MFKFIPRMHSVLPPGVNPVSTIAHDTSPETRHSQLDRSGESEEWQRGSVKVRHTTRHYLGKKPKR